MGTGVSALGTNPRRWKRIRRAILRRDNYQCRLLLPGCTSYATTVDHWVPRADGGTDDEENLLAACNHCNMRKGSGSPVFLDQQRLQNAGDRFLSPFFTPIEHRSDDSS